MNYKYEIAYHLDSFKPWSCSVYFCIPTKYRIRSQ